MVRSRQRRTAENRGEQRRTAENERPGAFRGSVGEMAMLAKNKKAAEDAERASEEDQKILKIFL